MRSWTVAVISMSLVGLAAFAPSAALAGTRVPGSPLLPRVARAARVARVAPVATTTVDEVAPVTPVDPAPPGPLGIDVPGLRRHVESIAKLIGRPADALAAKLGPAATIGDGTIEWNLADVGVDAASAYGYASVVDGAVTGFVIRGRAALDQLLRLHLHGPLQLTQAGGERPSYSITVGE